MLAPRRQHAKGERSCLKEGPRGCRCASELEHFTRAEMLEEPRIRGREPEAPRACVSYEKSIEGVAGPRDLEGLFEPKSCRGLIERPTIILRELGHTTRFSQLQPPDLYKHLHLEQRDRRNVEWLTRSYERPRTAMTGFEPNERMGVEKNHRRGFLRGVRAEPIASSISPSGPHVQCH